MRPARYAAVIGCAALLFAGSLWSFDVEPTVKWVQSQRPVPRVNNLSSIPDCCLTNNTVAGYEAVIAQAQNNLPSTPSGPVLAAPTRNDGLRNKNDGIVLTRFKNLGGFTLGQTLFWIFSDTENCGGNTFNRLSDTDVELNLQDDWVTNTSGVCQAGRYDIVGVTLHEYGHVAGLEHTNVESALMFAFFDDCTTASGRKETFQADDNDQFDFIYACESGGGGCRPAGDACNSNSQCCSGVCRGTRGTKTCQ
jgi:hypothetical protein